MIGSAQNLLAVRALGFCPSAGLNPRVVEGQVVGGVAHGLGNALFERMVYDDQGQPQSTTFGGYLLTTAPHMPNVEVHHMKTRSP